MPKPLIEHAYYMGNEAEQYVFYRFPKALITNEAYAGVSDGAKILYGLMLDRMGLSVRNRWLDANGRVYIFYPLDEVQEAMHCGHNKGVKIMAELEAIGLIERVRRGQGKPTLIYVKKFVSDTSSHDPKPENREDSHCPDGNDPQENPCFPKAQVQTSEKGKSRIPQSGSAELRKADANKTNDNHTDKNDIESILSYPPQGVRAAVRPDGWDGRGLTEPRHPEMPDVEQCRREIRRRIDYYSLIEPSQDAENRVNAIVELMVETLCSTSPTILMAGNAYPAKLVKDRFAQLTGRHIEYVTDCLRSNTTRIRNIRQYLLTALFNAPTTIDHYYDAEFNHLYPGAAAG